MTYNQRSGNAYAGGGGGGAAGLDQAAVEALIDARDFDAVVSRANATPSQAPTAAEIDGVTPENGTDVMVFLTDGTREHWQFDGTFWILQSSYTPATGTCLVPVSDPEPLGAATGTLADGTTWTVGNDQDPAGNVFSTVTPGDIRWPTAGPLTLTFSAPVTLLVSPTTLGDAAIGDPIVWGYQNGQGTFSQTSTRVTSDGDPMSYQPGAFDTTMVFSNGDLQANGNLPESAAPTASTDWGLLTAPRGTVFTVRDRNASAMNFQAVPLVERDVCDVLADLLLAEPEVIPDVPAEPMSTALPTSGTITATAGHVNYGTATLTADADIDTAALDVGDVASYELVVPAGVTLTLPADSTIVRGSIIEDFINYVQIEKVDATDHRVRIYSRPQITDTLVTRQDITGGTNFFASLAEANNFDAANPNPETSAKFSILDQVEGMRRQDGQLEFELRYPAAGITAGPTGADLVVRWEQTSNPFVGSSNDAGQNAVTGFQLISESPPFDQFGGLCLIGSSTTAETTFYNGQPGSTNWWSGVGAFATWTALGTGIPARADVGANHSTATIVELRVMNIGA